MPTDFTKPPAAENARLDTICDVAARCWNVPRRELTASTRPREDLGADSLDILQLLTELEAEFSVSIPDQAVERIGQLGDLLVYLHAEHG